MSGWVFDSKPKIQKEIEIAKLKKGFAPELVAPLQCRSKSLDDENLFLTWGWREAAFQEDQIAVDLASGDALILNGYLLDFGTLGVRQGDEAEDAATLLTFSKNVPLERIVEQLNGSFSIIHLAKHSGRITLFTDRFASRSIWFYCRKNERYAANLPGVIQSLMREEVEINEAGLWSLLATSRHVGEQGIFRGIINLQAGQKAIMQADGSHSVTIWHDRRYRPERGKSSRYWGGVIAETLKRSAVGHAKVTPSPYLFLSGGLDSRLVAGAYGKNLRTLTLTSHPNMNSRISARVAAHLGLKHQTLVRTPYWYLDTFTISAMIASGNYNIAHSHFIIPIEQTLQSDPNASFMLGDLLENFNKHYFRVGDLALANLKPRDIPDHFHKLFGFTHPDPKSLQKLFNGNSGSRAYESWREALIDNYRRIEPVSEHVEDRLDTLFRWNNCSVCPTYLMLESMLPFAPVRNLMFDNSMLDLLLRIPPELRGARKIHKWTLWHLDRELALIPDSNFWLPPILPYPMLKLTRKIRPWIGKTRRKFVSLKKKGPVIRTEGSWHMNYVWYRKDQKYREFIESRLLREQPIINTFIDRNQIRQSWIDFMNKGILKNFEIETLLSISLLQK